MKNSSWLINCSKEIVKPKLIVVKNLHFCALKKCSDNICNL